MTKPFVKWVGGKRRLVKEIDRVLSPELKKAKIFVEPMVGGGAFLFHVLENYPNIEQIIINDSNKRLIQAYKMLQENLGAVASYLKVFDSVYDTLSSQEKKKEFYYSMRDLMNSTPNEALILPAVFIFLNKTCFNSLYRENSKGEFNVPMGRYKRPLIYDPVNLQSVHNALIKRVKIYSGDFEDVLSHVTSPAVFYFDPPYKPISKTSSFTSYTKDGFGDETQRRLANFCRKLDGLGHKWLVSNSKLPSALEDSDFFNEIYSGFDIISIENARSVSADASKRKKISEIFIKNV